MTTKVQTDNANLPAKLALRRHFLRTYHADGAARILDCCQGGGRLWSRLRQEFSIAAYWGVDTKPKKGRLKIDSERILAQPGWPQTVVDIDTYGSPFSHWFAMLPNVTRPVTVFLTVGYGGPNRIRLSRLELQALGMTTPLMQRLTGAITHNLADMAVRYCLARAADYGLRIVECVEATASQNARYFGVRLDVAADNGNIMAT